MIRPWMVSTQRLSRLIDVSKDRSVVDIIWPGEMRVPEVRSRLGGRDPRGKGPYVSTRCFKREARFEAERANFPTAPIDLDDLANSLLEQYDKLDLETQQLARPKRILAPAWA